MITKFFKLIKNLVIFISEIYVLLIGVFLFQNGIIPLLGLGFFIIVILTSATKTIKRTNE